MKASVIRQLEKNVKELRKKCDESVHNDNILNDFDDLVIQFNDAEAALEEAKDKYVGN